MNKTKVTHIIRGSVNNALDNLNLLNEEVKKKYNYHKKIEICNSCPVRVNNVCSDKRVGEVVVDFQYYDKTRLKGNIVRGCGCNIYSKALSDSPCPLGKFENL